MTFIVCETTAAITTHIREINDVPISLTGFLKQPLTLCGIRAAWDTKLPITTARCSACITEYRRLTTS